MDLKKQNNILNIGIVVIVFLCITKNLNLNLFEEFTMGIIRIILLLLITLIFSLIIKNIKTNKEEINFFKK